MKNSKESAKKSQIVGVRMNPKIRYAGEIGAQKHGKTLSGFIEYSVRESVQSVIVDCGLTAFQIMEKVWHVEESIRFMNLAFIHPNLLKHDDEILFELICKNGFLWQGGFDFDGIDKEIWQWEPSLNNLIHSRLIENWNQFLACVEGNEGYVLPQWEKEKKAPKVSKLLEQLSKLVGISVNDLLTTQGSKAVKKHMPKIISKTQPQKVEA